MDQRWSIYTHGDLFVQEQHLVSAGFGKQRRIAKERLERFGGYIFSHKDHPVCLCPSKDWRLITYALLACTSFHGDKIDQIITGKPEREEERSHIIQSIIRVY
jgi:hypothetical protein